MCLPSFKGEDYIFKALSAGKWMIGKWINEGGGASSFKWYEPKIMEEESVEGEKAI
jgi:hypothetical protein